MTDPADTPSGAARRFLCVALLLALVAIGGTLFVTAAVDPTGYVHLRHPGWPRLCAEGLRGNSRASKMLAAWALDSNVLLLGNSRVGRGLRPSHPLLNREGERPYNLFFAGASMWEVGRVFDAVSARGSVRRVILGLDPGMFDQATTSADWRQEIADALGGRARGDTLRAWYFATLYPETAREALATLVDRDACAHPRHSMDGMRDFGDVMRATLGDKWPGHFAYIRGLLVERYERDAKRNALADGPSYEPNLRALAGLLRTAAERNVEVLLFTVPFHQGQHDIIRASGYGPQFEAWKRDLVALVRALPAAAQPPLWDFAYEHPLFARPFPDALDRYEQLPDFFEYSHFTTRIGDRVIERMLGAGCPEAARCPGRLLHAPAPR